MEKDDDEGEDLEVELVEMYLVGDVDVLFKYFEVEMCVGDLDEEMIDKLMSVLFY